jgi:acylphosphatase
LFESKIFAPAANKPVSILLRRMENKLLYKIHVAGHVQGVGFRWNAAREARDLGINGFIQNLPDGSVYIEAEGTSDQLNVFLEWCKRSPGSSTVVSVTYDLSPAADYMEFRIRS